MKHKPDMDGWTLAYELFLEDPIKPLSVWQEMNRIDQARYPLQLQVQILASVDRVPEYPIRKARVHVERVSSDGADVQDVRDGLRPLLEVLSRYRLRKDMGLGFIEDDSPLFLDRLTVATVDAEPGHGHTLVEIWRRDVSNVGAAA